MCLHFALLSLFCENKDAYEIILLCESICTPVHRPNLFGFLCGPRSMQE
jgi:hypothetical protein